MDIQMLADDIETKVLHDAVENATYRRTPAIVGRRQGGLSLLGESYQ